MAKKKQSAASNNGGAASARTRSRKSKATSEVSSSSKIGNSQAPARSAASPQPPSTQAIGEVAGQVWQALSDNGPQTVAALKKAVGVSDEIVLAAIGWLAREDKLEFETSGRSTTVSLR
jgi:hypothetical protein